MSYDKFLQELLNNISDGVAVYEAVDNGSNFVFKDINPIGEKLSKVKKADVLGKKLTEVFPGVKEYGLLDALKKTWETGETTNVPLSQYQDDRVVQTVENYVFKIPTGEVVAVYRDVTEEKKVKEDYERIFNSFQDLYYQTDLEGTVKLVSPSSEELSGYKPEEMIGRNATDVYADPSERQKFLAALKESGKVEDYELDLVKKSGDIARVSISSHLMLDENNNPVGVEGVMRNITERVQSEEDLRKSEERFRMLSDISTEGIAIHDKGIVVEVNNALCQMFGYTREEMVGQSAEKFATPESWEVIKKKITSGDRGAYESTGVRKDGSTLTVVLRGRPLEYRSKKMRVATFRDLSELQETRAELKATEKRFEDIARSVSDWIWETNKNGKYIFVSGKTMEILGYEPDEILGKTPFDFMTPEEVKRVKEVFAALSSENRPIVDLENWNIKKDGSKVLLLTNAVPVIDAQGRLTGYRGVDKDITQTKQSETKLQEIIDTSQELFYMHDNNHALQYVSPYCIQMFGYTPEEMMINWQDLTTDNPINEKGVATTEVAIKTGERQEPYLLELKKKDGTPFIVQIHEAPVRDTLGKVIGITGSARDVTKEKEAEKALQEKVAELEKMNKLMVGRELKMAEMKEQMKKNNQDKRNEA